MPGCSGAKPSKRIAPAVLDGPIVPLNDARSRREDGYRLNRRRFLTLAVGLYPTLVLVGCSRRRTAVAALAPGARVLALGDSLTAGQGAAPDEAWPARLAQSTDWQIDNEGVNGDTSAGALQRLRALLAENRYDAVLIAIGGNDMLRGVSRQVTKDNVTAIVRQALAHTSYVALIATPAPQALRASLGSLADADFYEEVAKAEDVLLIPSVYSTVLSSAELRSDRIHANAQGYARVSELLVERLEAAGWR